MFRRTGAPCFLHVFSFILLLGCSVSLCGQTQISSLRPQPRLVWQQVSPTASQPDGPVLYQLLFSAAGTAGTIAVFDTNPRHLTNSHITDNGSNVAVGGLLINDTTGIVTFAGGQTFPGTGTITGVTAGAGLSGGGSSGSVTLAANLTHDATLSGNGGSSSLGISSPLSLSQVSSTATFTSANTGSGNGINGSSSTGTGVFGTTSGISGLASGAAAVLGDSGTYFGVWGTSNSNQGVVGSSNTNYGMVGTSVSGLSGIYGTGGHNGVFGQTLSADDSGVLGRNDASSVTPSQAAAGVSGFSLKGWGVLARGDDSAHGGLTAFSQNGAGVLGQTGNAAAPAGVFNNFAGGKILSGQNNLVEKFFVDGAGSINGGLIVQPNGTSANILSGFGGNAITGGVVGAVIAGGGSTGAGNNNFITDDYGAIGGGKGNLAGDNAGTTSDQPYATVGGGFGNVASALQATVGGGRVNVASGSSSTICGGDQNKAQTFYDTVAGGLNNTANGNWSTVDGGSANTASGQFSIAAGGSSNTASGNYSFVAGGNTNTASGANSFAAGFKANASMDGSIVFATGNVNPWPAFAANRFEIFATGGFCFDGNETPGINFVCFSTFGGQQISTATGAYLSSPGGVWTNASDRNLKTNFKSLDAKDVLNKVSAMPIQQWKYKLEPDGKKHIGPMAQDFYAAFGLGDDDKHIGTIDEGGVALAAIQGLNQKLEDELKRKDAEIMALKADVEQLRQLSQQLLHRVAEVEQQAHQPRLQAAQ